MNEVVPLVALVGAAALALVAGLVLTVTLGQWVREHQLSAIVKGLGFAAGGAGEPYTKRAHSVVLRATTERRETHRRAVLGLTITLADKRALSRGTVGPRGRGATEDLIRTGDPTFDAAIAVTGLPADALGRLPKRARTALCRAVEAGWRLADGEWVVWAAGLDARGVERLIDHGVQAVLATRLLHHGQEASALEQLERLTLTDSSAWYRYRCFLTRLRFPPAPSPAWLRDAAASRGAVAAAAKAALDLPGQLDALRASLSDERRAVVAALALIGEAAEPRRDRHALALDWEAIEAVLIEALAGPLGDLAAEALGRVGSARAERALARCREPSMQRVLADARARIATRRRARAGELILADAQHGQLSVPDPPAAPALTDPNR